MLLMSRNDAGRESKLDVSSIVDWLKACANQKDLGTGSKLHRYIQENKVLEKNSFVANTLVSMYAKCGALAKAHQVVEELPIRDVVTWNALIAGYTQNGQGDQALKCFDSMQHAGHTPNAFTFSCALKACGSIGAAVKGKQIHEKIVTLGMLDENVVLGTALVDMYATLGAHDKAQRVHEELPIRDMVSWTALISGYAQWGQGEEALKCFDSMQCEGHSPNVVTFISVLKACGSIGVACKGKQIHDKIVGLGMLEKSNVLGSTLVDMYVGCGAFAMAQEVLQELPVRDVITWNVLIAGHVHQGQGMEALKCFDSMQSDGHSPNAVTFICALKVCGSIGAVGEGEQIHGKLVNSGMLEKNIALGNAVVDMYARCGSLTKAQQVVEELPVRDVITWTSLIARYVQHGQGEQALTCFDSMQCDGHFPHAITFICALKACGIMGSASKGKQIHDMICSLDMLEESFALGSTLVDMYVRCGSPANAHKVLKEFPFRDVVTWTALIAGYAQQGQGEEALNCLEDMQCEGHIPDAVTFICVLNACGNIGAAVEGEKVHAKIVNLGMLAKSVVLGTALVDMYARCSALAKARQVIEELPVREVVSWTALVARYAQQGQGEEALKCFDYMQRDGHTPDAFTFACALKACGSTGAAAVKGEQIHEKIVSLGMLERNLVLGNALVDMYARCGALAKAQQVLEELPLRDVVTWTALMMGYAQQGQGKEALKCFYSMQLEGHTPDAVTFTCALSACSHLGLACKAEINFSALATKYGLRPDFEHYCCMVDLFGRTGNFNRALDVIEEMPSAECFPVWVALLGACQKWGEVKVGNLAFKHALHVDKSSTGIGRQENARED